MNYIEQIKGFWIAQEVNQLGTSEIALYFHLLEICNKTGWTGSFNRNNYKVMADLSIRSPKTLQSVRDKLKQAGIIDFKQRNGDANCSYSMNDLSKFYRGNGIGKGEGSGKGKGEGSGIHNINQTKPNQTSKSHSKPIGSVKEKKETTVYWEKLVETWFGFYKEKFLLEPTFNAAAGKSLKSIMTRIKKVAESAGKEWTEEYAISCLKDFLKKAYGFDNWLRENFLLPTLSSRFDAIVKKRNDGKNGEQKNSLVGAVIGEGTREYGSL